MIFFCFGVMELVAEEGSVGLDVDKVVLVA